MEKKADIKSEIIKVLKYFNFFQFPLTKMEIQKYIGAKVNESVLSTTLDKLVELKLIYLNENCYLLSDNEEWVVRKKEAKILADKRMKRAHWISKIIMSFPFVRMVAVSGSLSKGYADKNSDIDFFIVTTENHLWTARTLLHLLKKISFIFRMQHSFCMNYFISNKHLKLGEQNYFTAIELVSLIPLKGRAEYEALINNNKWIEQFAPNFELEILENEQQKKGVFKSLFEIVFRYKSWNESLMNFTDRRWKKKWKAKGYPMEEYDLAFKTSLTVSKNHPSNFQKKILEHMEEKAVETPK